MVDIQSTTAEIRRGKKEDRKKKPQGKSIMSASATPLATLHKRPPGPALNKRWWVVAAKVPARLVRQ